MIGTSRPAVYLFQFLLGRESRKHLRSIRQLILGKYSCWHCGAPVHRNGVFGGNPGDSLWAGWHFAARAFGEEWVPTWLGMPANYYRDAFWIALGGSAL